MPAAAPVPALHFQRPAIVLQQPLLVALVLGFSVAVLVAAFGPWGGGEVEAESEPTPMSPWAWLFWLLVLAALALGAAMLCHAEHIVVDAAQRQVTQTHFLLRTQVHSRHWRFDDFSGVQVTLKLDTEHQGEHMPTGTATLATARTVHKRRYVLSLQRPDLVLHTAERRLTAPNHPLDLPLPDDRNVETTEAHALALAQLGGWPARRRSYTRSADGSVRVSAEADEGIG